MMTYRVFATGLRASYAAGQAVVQKLAADHARLQFIEWIWTAWQTRPELLTEAEAAFVCRLMSAANGQTPRLSVADASTCDSLRRTLPAPFPTPRPMLETAALTHERRSLPSPSALLPSAPGFFFEG